MDNKLILSCKERQKTIDDLIDYLNSFDSHFDSMKSKEFRDLIVRLKQESLFYHNRVREIALDSLVDKELSGIEGD